MFDTIKRIREKNAQLLCGSAIILALGISGCTTSGTSLLENVATDTTLANNQAAQTGDNVKDSTASPAQTSAASAQSVSASAAQATEAATPNKQAPAETAIAATNQIAQAPETAAAQTNTQPSTLAALFGTRTKPTAALAELPVATTETNNSTKQTETGGNSGTKNESSASPAPVLNSSPATAATTAPALDRTSQSAGAAARLFAPGKNSPRGAAGTQKPAVIASLSQKSTKDYSFTLPGVRANGGVEIRHSNKVFDESDIDLDEDDFSAPVTLASAGGMARLAPNGLRTQHDKVQVSCLKPQLVSMIKRLESHYRKPVVITSGYRSPTHNRSVSGAKRSLHMSCSAADLQIPGISKWEIARHVRTWQGRGGVGTYCHTESVHIDVGPERDWNWRCRRG
ncbi:YcbK family protein [Pseudochrobactrum sp. MP213Fo]|uniref:YcbK family protein n=1 Tax=Pseudochrobactrum sp. MP213Fo TaxID=3022250 RepID=UPI003B9E96A9